MRKEILWPGYTDRGRYMRVRKTGRKGDMGTNEKREKGNIDIYAS